ncbi:cysteine hydrolase family protein [Tomitella biformata]|uniref:cysteine hydrolase family protein n=1 Tax=Tomitella biformata TaxID=630403 RepID=UPI0004671842|nr:cysteine hydrolase family protein [Tomitella biformata]
MRLADLIEPRHTAVLVSEMQRGIAGDLVSEELSAISTAMAESGVAPNLARLLAGARQAHARVVHATLQFRPDRAGVRIVSPLMAVTMRDPGHLLAGSAQAEIMPEIGPEPTDIISARLHGMSAFTCTDLDPVLRSLDITTVIIGGVSLNEAIIGAAIEAVNRGYRVVIPRDAALGMPAQFAEDMLRHAFSLLGRVTTTDDILGVWSAS